MAEEQFYIGPEDTVMVSGQVTEFIDDEDWRETDLDTDKPFSEAQQSSIIGAGFFKAVSDLVEASECDKVEVSTENNKPFLFKLVKDRKTVGTVVVAPQVPENPRPQGQSRR